MELKWKVIYVLCFFANTYIVAQNTSRIQETSSLFDRNEEEPISKRLTSRAANILKEKFQYISYDELGLGALNETMYSLQSSFRFVTDEDLVLTISERLAVKINSAAQILFEMKKNLLNGSYEESFTYPCLSNSFRKTQLDNIEINSEKVTLNIPKNNCKVCVKNVAKKYNLKVESQYFMAIKDGATDRLCGMTISGSNSRKLFHRVLQPEPKFIIIVMDNGNMLNKEEFHVSLSLAKELINILQLEDTVSLISTANLPQAIKLYNQCNDEPTLYGLLTQSNKDILYVALNNLEIDQKKSNVSGALDLALKLIEKQNDFENTLLIYIGKKLSLGIDYKNLSNVTSKFIMKTSNKIKIAAYDVTVRNLNISNAFENIYDSDEFIDLPFFENSFIKWNSLMSIGQVASLLLLKLPQNPREGNMSATPPVWEPKQKHSLTPFVLPLYLPVQPFGLLVIQLYLSDVAEDIIYFNSFSTAHRAFIMDFAGNVIVHSSYPRPELIVTKPKLINIYNLETTEDFKLTMENMLRDSNGTASYTSVRYTWRWVKNIYIVCVVSEITKETCTYKGIRLSNGVARELQHHRMDLLPPPNTPLCRHFLTVSTIHKGTLYLSPSSFQSPFSYTFDLHNGKDVSLTLMQSYMAYLKDTTRLLSNPGLKPDVRNDVGILNQMLNYFKERHIRGAYNKYVVRRYATSEHGVLVLFPGTILESDFEPNRKPWFLRALREPGRIILTPPYLDIGGAGYIVTISQTPLVVTERSKPAIVLSMDMTMRYLYKMLLESLPLCTESNIRCFLMDDRGYLLSHPGLVDPSNSGPIEQTHITHEESLMANDMLNHKGFVQKNLCKNYADSTLQRYYQFNTSLDRILTNVVNGEHCVRYYMTAIPGTNVFIGMVNSTCNQGAFCPCSVVDRLCLNCNRMEQNECECPCECLLSEGNTCNTPTTPIPLCKFESERNHRNNFYTRRYNLAPHLDSCFDFQCESYNTRSSCLGVLGCEWCEMDRDGESILTAPFCTAQPACFGGVLGAPTPYESGSFGRIAQGDPTPTYSAVGPIVGCVVALCLILALAIYCYRQNSGPVDGTDGAFSPPAEAWSRTGVRLSRLGSEDDIHDERSGHRDKLLMVEEPAPPVSPYRILTGYRRPNTAGESDHGYSTMTPHEDSEHRAFAPVEPFPPREEGGSPALSTPRSSALDLPVTILPCGKNNVIAPVTVHRHMEAA